MYNFRGQVGLWLTTKMAISFPSLPFLLLSRMLYFRIPTCIFILIFNICDPCLTTRLDRVVCPLATIQLTNRERAVIWASIHYLTIAGLYLWILKLSATHNPALVFYQFFLVFLSLLYPWLNGRVDNSPFSLCIITSLDGISFIDGMSIQIHSI